MPVLSRKWYEYHNRILLSIQDQSLFEAEQEKVVHQLQLLQDQLPSLLEPHQVILLVPQEHLVPLAIPGPHIHRVHPHLQFWYPLRKKLLSYAHLRNLQEPLSNFVWLINLYQISRMSGPKLGQQTTSSISLKGGR